uniref:Transporter n=1 Tax=Strongyloides venezuelensis TaxID=75913 RepID=A0A0K0FJN8_STRVS
MDNKYLFGNKKNVIGWDKYIKSSKMKTYNWNRDVIKKYFFNISDSPHHDSFKNKDQITKKKLYTIKNEIRRCLRVSEPLSEMLLASKAIILWKRPFESLTYTFCFFYFSYYGNLLMVIFFLTILQLSMNYLYFIKNIPFFNIKIFPPRKTIRSPLHQKPSHQMLYIVLQKTLFCVYNLSNILEKINSIFVWQNEKLTVLLVIFISLLFSISFFLHFEIAIMIIVLCLSIKLFMENYFITNFSKTAKKKDFITYLLSEKPRNVGNVIKRCRKKMKNNKDSHCRKKKNLLNSLVLLKKEENLNDLLESKIRINNKVESLNNDLLCNPSSTPLCYGSNNNNDVIDNDNNKKIIKRYRLVNIDDNNIFNCRCCILLSSAKFYGKVKVGTLFIQKT